MIQKNRVRLGWYHLVGIILLIVAVFPASAFADTSISQGFLTDENDVASGAIMSANSKSDKTVQKASSASSSVLIGVVASGSLIELSTSNKELQVVTSGATQTLVSNINGPVKKGDRIAASPIKGVGMKSLESGYIIGVAQASFNEATDQSTRSIKDKSGKTKDIKIGMMPVQVAPMYYEKKDDDKSLLPVFLTQIARSIVGREVPVVRVMAALVVLLAGFVAISALLYASVRSSIISIGRNPLAAKAVHRSLVQVVLMAIGVLLIMLTAVYLILVI